MKKSRPEALYSERQVGSGTSALKSENQALVHVLIIQPRRKCGPAKIRTDGLHQLFLVQSE
jgi:hypothetical protein